MDMEIKIGNTTITLQQGDITEIEADAIVNAANNHLWMGGGVAGAIKRKGGKIIEDEAVKLGPIPIGEAVATTAGKLNAKYVIHAAGMGTDLKTDEEKIRNATLNSLKRANELKIKSIAFPSIGTGVGGFPLDTAADIMLRCAIEHVKKDTSLENVIFVLYQKDAYKIFENVLGSLKR
ncbi:MAG: macro domain-containing protein [Thermoplasmata archaeon]|nr:MAG: macro domain-containing protein [Thermoplasmata archaeon]